MADLTITETNVSSSAVTESGTAGEQITAGDAVYLDATTGEIKAALNDSAAHSAVKGIAINRAEDGQPVSWVPAGNVSFGAILTVGEIYVLSANAGKIAPEADNGSGEYVTVLGVATSTSVLKLGIINSGVAVP